MNKSELITMISNKAGFTKKDTEKLLNATLESISEALKSGEKVQLVGFGNFEAKERPARIARNPRTGEEISISATKSPVFKAGKVLKEFVGK